MLEALLVPFFKLIGFDYKNKREKDKVLLEKFLELLPVDGNAIDLLREQDMAAPFRINAIKPLNDLVYDWNGADKDFQVKRLETLKKTFITDVHNFLELFSKYSGSDVPGFISIGMKDFEDNPKMFEIASELNTLTSKAMKSYESFVRAARAEI